MSPRYEGKPSNRTSDTLRTPGQDPTHRTYTYPQAGQPQPHALQQVTTTSDTGNINYTYDPAGNTTTREVDGILQTLTWNTEGHLEAVSEDGDQTTMIYDADGSRLIRDDGDTLSAFLPQTELVWNKTTDQVQGTRYFTHNGQVVATCTGQDVADWTWMSVDHHGTTVTHSVNAFTGVDHVRRMDPYGNTRGPRPQTWPGQQGYVAGIHDPTGLIHIGARTYDPTTGRFITIDPILDTTDHQQINGYTYANNNPTTWDDPTGLCFPGCWLPDGMAIPTNSTGSGSSSSGSGATATCIAGNCCVTGTPTMGAHTLPNGNGGHGDESATILDGYVLPEDPPPPGPFLEAYEAAKTELGIHFNEPTADAMRWVQYACQYLMPQIAHRWQQCSYTFEESVARDLDAYDFGGILPSYIGGEITYHSEREHDWTTEDYRMWADYESASGYRKQQLARQLVARGIYHKPEGPDDLPWSPMGMVIYCGQSIWTFGTAVLGSGSVYGAVKAGTARAGVAAGAAAGGGALLAVSGGVCVAGAANYTFGGAR